jgi:hypothetical protein
MGFKSGKANTLTSVALPGPGAVTMLSRPVEKIDEPGGDAYPRPVVTIRFEARKDRWYDARRRR